MNEESEWNWKAVILGALSNPLFVVGIGSGILFGVMIALAPEVPADEVGLSEEERQQKRAAMFQELKEQSEATKHDPKRERFNQRFQIGMTAAWCASEVLQGFVAGRMAKRHPLAHAGASYLLTFVVGKAMSERWMRSEFFRDSGLFDQNRSFKKRLPRRALKVVCILLGGYLSRRK